MSDDLTREQVENYRARIDAPGPVLGVNLGASKRLADSWLRLEAKCDALRAEVQERWEKNYELAAETYNVEQERDALRAALAEYGSHHEDCMYPHGDCSCGLAAARRLLGGPE